MRLLVDTHILVWLATDHLHLNGRELSAIENEDSTLLLSSVSLWELRTKVRSEVRRGVRMLDLDPSGAIALCARLDIAIAELHSSDTTLALAVEPPHGDPFDEMLLVHAQRLGARLLTRDRKLLGHPLSVF